MNTHLHSIALFFLVFLFAAVSGQNLDLPNLEYLEGSWFVEEAGMFEDWKRTSEGYEVKVFVMQGGERTLFESATISRKDEVWTYSSSWEGAEPIDFPLTAVDGTKMTFENKDNEMPQLISYWQGDDGKPRAYVEGTMEGQPMSIEFTYGDPVAVPDAPDLPDASFLGQKAQISIGVADLNANAEFYQAVGFQLVASDNAPWPWAWLSDGSVNLVLNQDGNRYFGLSYFDDSHADRKSELGSRGITFIMENQVPVPTYVFSDPDGQMGFALVEVARPDLKVPAPMSEGACGKLGEIAVPVSNFDTAAIFYEQLGFSSMGSYKQPYPWGIFSDGLMILGLHQTEMFKVPAITYFSPESGEHIARLKEAGLEVKELSMMGPGNAVVVSPEGYPINVFKGDL